MGSRTIVFLVFSLTCSITIAQKPLSTDFILLTTKQGLSHNYVTGIQQDRRGYIWISTKRGLNRFDGINFKQFLTDIKGTPISGNDISSISMFDGNQLAISTESGGDVIYTENLSATKLTVPSDTGFQYWSNAFRYISKDGKGNYVASTKTGFYVFSPSGKLMGRYDHYTKEQIGKKWMSFGSYLYPLKNGDVLLDSQEGLLVYNIKRNKIVSAIKQFPQLASFINEQEKSRDRFIMIAPDKILFFNSVDNTIELIDITSGNKTAVASPFNLVKVIGWQSNFVKLNSNRWVFNAKDKGLIYFTIDLKYNIIDIEPKKHLEGYLCTNLAVDQQKRLWVGTNEGILMQRQRNELIKSFPMDTKTSDPDLKVTVIYPMAAQLVAGTNGNTLFIIDRQTMNVNRKIIFQKSDLPHTIRCFLQLHRDTLLIGSSTGLYWMHTSNYTKGKKNLGIDTKNEMIRDLFRDQYGKIWITTFSINKIFIYDPIRGRLDSIDSKHYPELQINSINSIAEDKIGNIWMGGDAIVRWNRKSDRIDTVITKLKTQRNSKKGFSVIQNSKGEIWTTINDDGFARIFPLPVQHIRPSNFVLDYSKEFYPYIIDDKIFVPTLAGFGLLNTINGKTVVLNEHDGIPQATATSYRFYKDTEGNLLWYATDHMVHAIRTDEKVLKQNAPSLTISEIYVLQDTVIHFPGETLGLQHDQNDIRVTVSAVNYADPSNMRFAYRFLNSQDSNWIDLGTQQSILLTNVSPGFYKLEVKVYAHDNKWNENFVSFSMKVNPPFWETIWFYSLTGGFTILVIYLLYRRHIKHLHQRAYLDQQLAETEMKALHSQMNPHFIFNCMNSIREMILNNENRDASNYLSKFAHLLRATLENSTHPFISLKQTIDYLRRYLELEQIRTSHFRFTISVDEDITPEEIWLPPMLIQPLLENAIWHGSASEREMELNIRFEQKGEQIVCVVEDDGIGINASLEQKRNQADYNSYGIDNIKQRIALLNEKHGLKSYIDIQDKAELYNGKKSGTKVILHLPVKKEYYGKRVTYDIG